MNLSSMDCCQYPILHIKKLAFEGCVEQCNATAIENETASDECCKSFCYFDSLDVYLDNHFEKSNFKKLFAKSFTDEGDSVLTEEWEPIVVQNIDKCYKIRKF